VSQLSISANDLCDENSTYVNWPQLDKDSAIGPSPVSESKANDDEESLAASSVYDPEDLYDG